MENYIPKVGDVVKITKSENNWVYGMDVFDGIEVTIDTVIYTTYRHKNCYKVSFTPDDSGIEDWSWIYECGHFQPVRIADHNKSPLKLKIKL